MTGQEKPDRLDPDGDYAAGEPCEHGGRDCMYGAADKASAALNSEMTKYQGPGKGSLPIPDPASLKENSRGDAPDDSRSNNFGVFGHKPDGQGDYRK